jgi:DNA recombination protein RmuC
MSNLFIGFALGGILCGIIGWLLGSRHRNAPTENRLEGELRQQIAQRESELSQSRSQFAKTAEQNAALTEQLRSLNERLTAERQQIEALQQKFQTDFEAVSNKLLASSSSQFNKQSRESLEILLTPLKDELKEFKAKLDNSQRETATHTALLKDQIARVGSEAANLSKALKGDVKALGNWGENMLDQILEKSGLQAGLHYIRQRSAKGEDGDQRFLDVIVELPDNKHLVIDSKVSLKCYEEQVNSLEESLRIKHLEDHVACIRNHFRALGAKRYQDLYGINAPDFVLMYIPIEPAFFVAVAHDPGLFSEALDKNVVLTTNSTLLATLRTVASVWRLADQQKNAIEIARRGGQLYDKFVGFVEDLQQVGTTLKKGQDAWEAAMNKLQSGAGNLVRQAEQLKALGVKASKSLPRQVTAKAEVDAPMQPVVIPMTHPEAPGSQSATK